MPAKLAAASRRIFFVIPTYQDDALKTLAQDRGVAVAVLIREAVDALLARSSGAR